MSLDSFRELWLMLRRIRLEFASRVSFLMALAVCIVHDFKNGEVFIVS